MNLAVIIAAIEKAIGVAATLLEAGRSITPIAKELFDVIGKNPDDITDDDLDRLAQLSDEAHAEVQKPIED